MVHSPFGMHCLSSLSHETARLACCAHFPGEGFSGYFGSVTKEALCDWQRDSGLEVTGSFNTASHLEYLRQKVSREETC